MTGTPSQQRQSGDNTPGQPQVDQGADRVEHVEHDFTGPLTPGVARLLRVFGSICVVLFVADFLIEREAHSPGEHLPGFYPVYGFVGCVLLVLLAKEMRKLVMRDEDYYQQDPDAAGALAGQPASDVDSGTRTKTDQGSTDKSGGV